MAKKGKQYRDKYGRFAKRGQPTKPVQPRIQGRYISRPAPLRLGINKAGKRYWIQPRPKRSREAPTGIGRGSEFTREGPTHQRSDAELERSIDEIRKSPSIYGYKIDDFLAIQNHPSGYSYLTYHIYLARGSDVSGGAIAGGRIQTVRGRQYNTPEEVRSGWQEEVEELEHRATISGRVPPIYLYTVVAVTPVSGAERTPGSVYPEDYHPKERPGTREFEIEQGRARAKRFWDTGTFES